MQRASGHYDLEAAFAETIIGGPASFVVTADGDDRFAQAVRRKLLLEIAGTPVPAQDLRVAGRRGGRCPFSDGELPAAGVRHVGQASSGAGRTFRMP